MFGNVWWGSFRHRVSHALALINLPQVKFQVLTWERECLTRMMRVLKNIYQLEVCDGVVGARIRMLCV